MKNKKQINTTKSTIRTDTENMSEKTDHFMRKVKKAECFFLIIIFILGILQIVDGIYNLFDCYSVTYDEIKEPVKMVIDCFSKTLYGYVKYVMCLLCAIEIVAGLLSIILSLSSIKGVKSLSKDPLRFMEYYRKKSLKIILLILNIVSPTIAGTIIYSISLIFRTKILKSKKMM